MPTATCPYCGVVLDNMPKRKVGCPACHQPIFVRKGRLLTEERVELEAWIASLDYLGVTEAAYEERRQKLSRQFSERATLRDTAWSFLNGAVGKGDWRHHERIYLHMARVVESEGKSAAELYAEARRWEWKNAQHELERMRRGGVTHVEIQSANDANVCPACQALAGRTYPIRDALAGKLVPHKCQRACRCWYTPASPGHAVLDRSGAKAHGGNTKKGCLGLLSLAIVVLAVALLV